jgi:hypothetical protein
MKKLTATVVLLILTNLLYSQNPTYGIDENYNLSASLNNIPIKLKLDTGAAMSTIDTIFLNSKNSYLKTEEYRFFLDITGDKKKFQYTKT